MFARTTFIDESAATTARPHRWEGVTAHAQDRLSIVAIGIVASLAVAGCSSSKKTDTGTGGTTTPPASTSTTASGGTLDGKGAKVGIILPDTTSSPRWVTADPTALAADCKKDSLTCDIQNAQGERHQDGRPSPTR